ncbi:MAG: shikimate dehydrogenase [Turneriella sp.]
MKIDALTRLYGIIGNPLSHTFSPAMHNAGFAARGINAVYLAFPLQNLTHLKYSMRQWSIQGLSVTIPYKISIRRLLDRIDPLALQIGSVNTLRWGKDDALEGYNTDGPGAIMALKKEKIALKGKKVLVIGSGGSARSIGFALAQEKPAQIGIMARNALMAMQLARNLRLNGETSNVTVHTRDASQQPLKSRAKLKPQGNTTWPTDPDVLATYNLIINTTPMGMKGSESAGLSPLALHELHRHQTVFDIVYNPAQTPLLKHAKKRGCGIVLGYKMLLYQGVLQFELFTGKEAPVREMEQALLAQIRKVS